MSKATPLIIIVAVSLIIFLALAVNAQSPQNKEDSSIKDEINIILKRNIFDKNRNTPKIETKPIKKEIIKEIPKEYMTLTGVMVTKTEGVAFFDCPASSHSIAVLLDNTILSYKLIAIDSSKVELFKDEKIYKVFVGEKIEI